MRPIKPIDNCEGHRTKDEIERRKEAELNLIGDTDKVIKPPKVLVKKRAKDEYKRVANELLKMKFVGNMDTSMLAVYAQLYSDYCDITDLIKCTPDTALKIKLALIKAQQKYVDSLLKFSSRFGLTTVDRLRFSLPKLEKNDPDEYDEF